MESELQKVESSPNAIEEITFSRDVLTFTNIEIVELVDEFVHCSRVHGKYGDCEYRKIEIKENKCGCLEIRIKFSENLEDEDCTFITGFRIDNIFPHDFKISSINIVLYSQEELKEWGINLDFDGIENGFLEYFNYFKKELRFWDSSLEHRKRNESITSEWTMIDEHFSLL